MKAPVQIEKEVISLANAFRKHSEQSIDNIRNPVMFRRIMSEMKFISSNRNSHISIFPCKDDLTFWSVILNGPETSVYEGGTFLLYIKYGDQYPASPPEFRFLTPIYHCNISSTGRICHSILGQFYSSDTKIKKILDCIYGLLLTPEPNDPLDSNVAAMYKDNPENFRYIAKYWVQNYASAQADALLKGIDIRVSMSPDFIDAYNGDIMQMPIFVESLGCNLDRSTVDNILANPQAYPGIAIDPQRLMFNNELYARIQEYLGNLGA
jgi:ubiquitin-protein ligase